MAASQSSIPASSCLAADLVRKYPSQNIQCSALLQCTPRAGDHLACYSTASGTGRQACACQSKQVLTSMVNTVPSMEAHTQGGSSGCFKHYPGTYCFRLAGQEQGLDSHAVEVAVTKVHSASSLRSMGHSYSAQMQRTHSKLAWHGQQKVWLAQLPGRELTAAASSSLAKHKEIAAPFAPSIHFSTKMYLCLLGAAEWLKRMIFRPFCLETFLAIMRAPREYKGACSKSAKHSLQQ